MSRSFNCGPTYWSSIHWKSMMPIEREVAIQEELKKISNKYSIKEAAKRHIYEYYAHDCNIKVGELFYNYKIISRVLEINGYSEEEISKYIDKNYIRLENRKNELIFRLAILNRCNLMEDAVINKNSTILSRYCSEAGLTSRLMFAYAKSMNYECTIDNLMKAADFSQDKIKALVKHFTLKQEELNDLVNGLNEKLFTDYNKTKKMEG